MPLITLGINHKTAPVEIRERVAFGPETMNRALKSLVDGNHVSEGAIVSTCNRTELYLSLQDQNARDEVVTWLADFHKLSRDDLSAYLYEHDESSTVRHILRVSSGIDSMILGEPQILGQMKDAYRHAVEAGTAGTLLNRLFQYSFTVAKQVRTDTAIGSSPVSVAFAAVRLAKQIFGDLNQYTVLLIGAGETIELAARHLHDQSIGRMVVANRTYERAHDLATEFDGYAIALNEIPAHLEEADIVISSTASPNYIIEQPAIKAALEKRKHKPVFMVDLAVPRDLDPAIAGLEDIYLYTIDDLHHVIQENMQTRQNAATQAEEIIDVQVGHFLGWKRSLEAVDTIRGVRRQAENTRDEVLEKAQAQLASGKPPEEVLQFLANTLTNKLIHSPSANLRQAGEQGRSELIKLAQTLFDLDATDNNSRDAVNDSSGDPDNNKPD